MEDRPHHNRFSFSVFFGQLFIGWFGPIVIFMLMNIQVFGNPFGK